MASMTYVLKLSLSEYQMCIEGLKRFQRDLKQSIEMNPDASACKRLLVQCDALLSKYPEQLVLLKED